VRKVYPYPPVQLMNILRNFSLLCRGKYIMYAYTNLCRSSHFNCLVHMTPVTFDQTACYIEVLHTSHLFVDSASNLHHPLYWVHCPTFSSIIGTISQEHYQTQHILFSCPHILLLWEVFLLELHSNCIGYIGISENCPRERLNVCTGKCSCYQPHGSTK